MGNAGRNRAGCCKNGAHRTEYQLLRAGLLYAVQRWLQGVPHAVRQRHLLRSPCATVSAQKAKCSLPANRSSFIRAARCLSKQTTLSSCSSAISICRRCKKSAGIRTICRSADRICTSYKPKKSLLIINREGFLYHLIITDTPH